MTIQDWEKASGLIHAIKKIESLIEQIKQDATASSMFARITISGKLREAVRKAIIEELEEELTKRKDQLNNL